MKDFKIISIITLGLVFASLFSGCASISRLAGPAPGEQETFTFVVMGDAHVPPEAKADLAPAPYFRRAIKEVNLLDPDFVIIVGDLIPGYSDNEEELKKMWDAFDTVAADFRVPYYQVVGNHDASNGMMTRVYLERYGERFPLYYSFDHKGCHFIVLDSVFHGGGLEGEFQDIEGEQLEWLKKDLERNRDARRIFVFLHHHLWFFKNSSGWTKEVHPLLAEYGVDTVFCGHWHIYRKDERDGVRYVVTGGSGAVKPWSHDFTGSFHHYCVATVRENRTSIAVVRTGHIEDEEVFTEELNEKYYIFEKKLMPIVLRLERDVLSLPDEFEAVIANPFDEKLSGTLTWKVPAGSPWRMPAGEIEVSVEPGGKQILTIPVPPGGSADDTDSLSPLPRARWNLSVGEKSLWKGVHTGIEIDRWPYRETKKSLRRAASLRNSGRVTLGLRVEEELVIPWKNSTEWPLEADLSWRFPGDCHWEILPPSTRVKLAAGEKGETGFKLSFSGSAEEVFPLPQLDLVVRLDGEEVVRTTARFPVDAREYFEKRQRTARCRRTDTPPHIDGKLNDGIWQECPPESDFVPPSALGQELFRTEGRFAYDTDNLYLAFRCYEPNVGGLEIKAREHDDPVWKDDSLEVFLDSNFDRKTYYRFGFSANAIVLDSFGLDRSWNGTCVAKAGREDDAWTLEIALPWKTLGTEAPDAGARIGLEITRFRAQRPDRITQWSPTFGGNHVPSRFGTLILE